MEHDHEEGLEVSTADTRILLTVLSPPGATNPKDAHVAAALNAAEPADVLGDAERHP